MRTTEKISILTVALLLFVSFSSFSQSRQDKANVIINKMKLAQLQRMYFETMVKPLTYHATGNDSVKLVELDKQLTDEHITKVINTTFDELLSDEDIDDIYNFTKTSIYKRLFESGEITDAVSARLGMFDIELKIPNDNMKDRMEKPISMFKPIPIDREDGFYATVDYNKSIEDKDIILEEKPSLTSKDIQGLKKVGGHKYIKEISILFTKEGAEKFYAFTKENGGKPMAIVIAKRIVSMPTINLPIKGGTSSITGNFTDDEVDKMIERLRAN